MIRQQQAQIVSLQANQPHTSQSAVDDSTPTSERSLSLPHPTQQTVSPLPSSIAQPRSRSPFAMSRQSSRASRTSSHAGSPALRPMSGGPHDSHEWLPASATTTRDESAFYQAETQMLTRENQMLKLRIRELGMWIPMSQLNALFRFFVFTNSGIPERQLAANDPTSSITRSPAQQSTLHNNPPVSRSEQQSSSEPGPPPES